MLVSLPLRFELSSLLLEQILLLVEVVLGVVLGLDCLFVVPVSIRCDIVIEFRCQWPSILEFTLGST